MKKISQHIENNNRNIQPVFDRQNPDADNLMKLWEECGQVSPPQTCIDDIELELALRTVHNKIENTQTTITPIVKKTSSRTYLFLAAAAAILLAVGISWMIAPQKITIPYGETATIQLPDGSRVSLNSGTTLTRNKLFGITNRNISLNGEAFFNVEKDDTPFLVTANNAVVKVTGTSFNVRSWKDEPDVSPVVSVQSGQIHFYSKNNPDSYVVVNPGKSSVLPIGATQPDDPISFNSDWIFAWKNNNLSFNNQTLSTIFKQLERTFNVKIDVQNSEIESSFLTTYYSRPDDLESVLNDICTVKGLTYTRTANGFMIHAK